MSFGVPITDDKTTEGSESFNLYIDPSSLPSSVTVYHLHNTTVTILDQNSKCKYFLLNFSYGFFGTKKIVLARREGCRGGWHTEKLVLEKLVLRASISDISRCAVVCREA